MSSFLVIGGKFMLRAGRFVLTTCRACCGGGGTGGGCTDDSSCYVKAMLCPGQTGCADNKYVLVSWITSNAPSGCGGFSVGNCCYLVRNQPVRLTHDEVIAAGGEIIDGQRIVDGFDCCACIQGCHRVDAFSHNWFTGTDQVLRCCCSDSQRVTITASSRFVADRDDNGEHTEIFYAGTGTVIFTPGQPTRTFGFVNCDNGGPPVCFPGGNFTTFNGVPYISGTGAVAIPIERFCGGGINPPAWAVNGVNIRGPINGGELEHFDPDGTGWRITDAFWAVTCNTMDFRYASEDFVPGQARPRSKMYLSVSIRVINDGLCGGGCNDAATSGAGVRGTADGGCAGCNDHNTGAATI